MFVNKEKKEAKTQCINIFSLRKNIINIREVSIDPDDLVDKFSIFKKQE